MNTLICPHCHHKNFYDAYELPWDEDTTTNHTCGECGQEFVVRANMTIEHETAKTEDDF